MKATYTIALACALTAATALASNVRTDYDHNVNFEQYRTYSWGRVKTSNPFYVSRIQQAVDQELAAKGWQLQPSGGSVTIFATDNIRDQKQVETMYDGFGGGWRWRRWGGGPGFGEATTTTIDKNVGNLVVDLFEANSKELLWRGLARENLSKNEDKNTKELDGDIHSMFKNFPPKSGK